MSDKDNQKIPRYQRLARLLDKFWSFLDYRVVEAKKARCSHSVSVDVYRRDDGDGLVGVFE